MWGCLRPLVMSTSGCRCVWGCLRPLVMSSALPLSTEAATTVSNNYHAGDITATDTGVGDKCPASDIIMDTCLPVTGHVVSVLTTIQQRYWYYSCRQVRQSLPPLPGVSVVTSPVRCASLYLPCQAYQSLPPMSGVSVIMCVHTH